MWFDNWLWFDVKIISVQWENGLDFIETWSGFGCPNLSKNKLWLNLDFVEVWMYINVHSIEKHFGFQNWRIFVLTKSS